MNSSPAFEGLNTPTASQRFPPPPSSGPSTSFLNGPIGRCLWWYRVLQNPARHTKSERFRAICHASLLPLFFVTLVSHWHSTTLSWITCIVLQLIVVIVASYQVFLVMEYEERRSDAGEVERHCNPLSEWQLAARVLQVFHLLCLGRWVVALLLFAPQIAVDVMQIQMNPHSIWVDPTALWKSVRVLDRNLKIKLVAHGLLFVVLLVVMLLSLLRVL